MYAVIETGGKQYRVQKGDIIDVERVGASADSPEVKFDVLLLADAIPHRARPAGPMPRMVSRS